ncbi:hypothetical protein [Shewanella maritima]|uniref:hypothetical protein n=1 Tax=Shewanella maritima TaxID=2520507 RepID=UPI003735E687
MLNFKLSRLMLGSVLLASFVGCSSDSDEDTTTQYSYFQYYNASANSTLTALVLDDYTYSGIDFADAIPRYSYSEGSSEVSILGLDEDGNSVELLEADTQFDLDTEHLFVLYGDFHTPQLLDLQFNREDMDDLNDDEDNDYSKMQVLIANVSAEDSSYDAYISLATQSFTEATALGNVGYGEYSQEQVFDTGEYLIYLTEPGSSEVIYTTSIMGLTDNTAYKMLIRPSFGVGELKLVIDSVDSTTTVQSYPALESLASINIYNGLDSQDVDIQIASQQETQFVYDIQPFSLSEFQNMGYNDYAVSGVSSADDSSLFDNVLVTFNQDEVYTLIVYSEDDTVKTMAVSHDLRPRPYESLVAITNLVDVADNLAVYFVRDSETIETAQYQMTDIDFEEQQSELIPHGDYDISIVKTDDNGTQTLMYQSESFEFNGDSNYQFILVPDSTSSFGHRLTLL